MPIPTPKADETEDEFIERCMGDNTMVSEYPDTDQRLAVCNAQLDDSRNDPDGQIRCRVLGKAFVFNDDWEVRSDNGELPEIRGYAAVFDSPTELWPGVTEEVARGAFTRSLKEGADVRALIDHDPSKVLGRNKSGTLSLREDEKGLRIAINPPDTQVGRDIVELIRRKDVNQMSFSFAIRSEEVEYTESERKHRLTDVDLFDVSVVTFPAYKDTIATLGKLRSAKRATMPAKPDGKKNFADPVPKAGYADDDPVSLRERARIVQDAREQKRLDRLYPPNNDKEAT